MKSWVTKLSFFKYLRRGVILVIPVIICSANFAQDKPDKRLQKKIQELVSGFEGEVGIFVKCLRTGKTANVNADTIFPTASMIKIPILIGVMDKIQKGELNYQQTIIYRDSLLYPGEDLLGSVKQDEKIVLGKIIMLMLTLSDNTASLWLQSLAGTGTHINELMDNLGLKNTRVNSRTPGRATNQSLYGWGQTTPREMCLLMEKIYKGEVINKHASSMMLRLLGRNFYDEYALSAIPPYIFVASKNGAVNQSRSETLLVMSPNGPYIFSIITKNQKDQSWDASNAGWVMASRLSALLWNYFGPGSKPVK
ncbi:MAG: serine hydrolase [Chitinophagaceae bacterium]|nr:MAG: serine hydrolase [Chitinophagaceae bacterium]